MQMSWGGGGNQPRMSHYFSFLPIYKLVITHTFSLAIGIINVMKKTLDQATKSKRWFDFNYEKKYTQTCVQIF